MKRGCQQIELLFAAYVDDEAETAAAPASTRVVVAS